MSYSIEIEKKSEKTGLITIKDSWPCRYLEFGHCKATQYIGHIGLNNIFVSSVEIYLAGE